MPSLVLSRAHVSWRSTRVMMVKVLPGKSKILSKMSLNQHEVPLQVMGPSTGFTDLLHLLGSGHGLPEDLSKRCMCLCRVPTSNFLG